MDIERSYLERDMFLCPDYFTKFGEIGGQVIALLSNRCLLYTSEKSFGFSFWRTYCLSAPALYPAESLFTSTLFNIYSPSGTILLEEQDAMSSGKASNEIVSFFKISIVFDMQR